MIAIREETWKTESNGKMVPVKELVGDILNQTRGMGDEARRESILAFISNSYSPGNHLVCSCLIHGLWNGDVSIEEADIFCGVFEYFHLGRMKKTIEYFLDKDAKEKSVQSQLTDLSTAHIHENLRREINDISFRSSEAIQRMTEILGQAPSKDSIAILAGLGVKANEEEAMDVARRLNESLDVPVKWGDQAKPGETIKAYNNLCRLMSGLNYQPRASLGKRPSKGPTA